MRNSSLDEFVGGADGDESDAERAEGETADPGGEGDTDPDPEPDPETETGSEPTTGADQQEDGSGGSDRDTDEGAVEPAVSTLDWTPDGAACAGCGEPSERRWRDDGELVCSSCKTW